MRCGVPPYRKLTLAEAFDKSTIPNASGSSSKREQRGGSQCAYAKAAALLVLNVDRELAESRGCVWEWTGIDNHT